MNDNMTSRNINFLLGHPVKSSGEGEKTPTLLGPLEAEPVSETLCFLVSRIPDNGQSPKTL
jgi:hypothetical protein